MMMTLLTSLSVFVYQMSARLQDEGTRVCLCLDCVGVHVGRRTSAL